MVNPLAIGYCLSMLVSGKIKSNQIFLAGFDGYADNDARNDEVNDLLSQFKNSYPNSNVIAITPTKYRHIISKSVYGLF